MAEVSRRVREWECGERIVDECVRERKREKGREKERVQVLQSLLVSRCLDVIFNDPFLSVEYQGSHFIPMTSGSECNDHSLSLSLSSLSLIPLIGREEGHDRLALPFSLSSFLSHT